MNRIRPKREERDRVTRRENEPRETQSLTVFHASLTGGSFSFNILTAISFVKSISFRPVGTGLRPMERLEAGMRRGLRQEPSKTR